MKWYKAEKKRRGVRKERRIKTEKDQRSAKFKTISYNIHIYAYPPL